MLCSMRAVVATWTNLRNIESHLQKDANGIKSFCMCFKLCKTTVTLCIVAYTGSNTTKMYIEMFYTNFGDERIGL